MGRRLGVLLLLVCGAAHPASAQLPRASAADLGLGNHTVGSVRGFAAVAANPAGLGMPGAARVTVAVLPLAVPPEFLFPLRFGSAPGPITLADFAEYDGRSIPASVREAWLQEIERKGRQTYRAQGSTTAAAVSWGQFGFQLSTLGVTAVELNPDAAELLLFGNAGRTGEARDFRLGGSTLDLYMVTTAAVAVGLPLDVEIGDAPGQAFAVGATLKYTVGNALYLARDLGSFLSGDPLEVWLRFPVVQTEGSRPTLRSADGVALDVGFQWESSPWAFGLTARNLVSTFRWDAGPLVFRPGTALFTQDAAESDFEPRPATEAPDPLREEIRAFRFGPRVAAGLSHQRTERTTWVAQLEAGAGTSADTEPKIEAGLGVVYRPTERLPLRAHASVLGDGFRIGGGVGVRVGNAYVSGGLSLVSGRERGASVAMLSVSLGGS